MALACMTWDLGQEEQDGQGAGRELTPGSAQRISCHAPRGATHAYGYQEYKRHPEPWKIQEREAQLHCGKLQHRMRLQPSAQGRDQARKTLYVKPSNDQFGMGGKEMECE